MNRPPSALFRGRVSIRPWRVGLLVDVDDEAQVREAIAGLTGVWGGIYLPILDRNAPVQLLRGAAEVFDLDSLYAEDADGEFKELLSIAGHCWRGRGPWGPFSPGEGGVRKGLLLAQSFQPNEQVANKSAYTSRVIAADVCPSIRCTPFGLAPAWIEHNAQKLTIACYAACAQKRAAITANP